MRKELFRDHSSSKHLTAKRAREIVSRTSFQTSQNILEPYESLDVGAAKILAAVPKGGLLDLSGILELPAPVAAALSSYEGYLGLHSLRTLSLAAAKHLATHKGGLYLGRLGSLSDEVAAVVITFRDSLAGNDFLSDGRLGQLKRQVSRRKAFDGLQLGPKLTASIAKRIRSDEIRPFTITGCFGAIDKEAAQILVSGRQKDDLDLGGVRTLSADEAEALMQCKAALDLSGLEKISAITASVIGKQWTGGKVGARLLLDGLRTLPEDSAKGLSGCRGPLSLNGVEEMTLDAASCLTRCSDVELQGLLRVDDEVLEMLAKKRSILLSDALEARAKQAKARRTVLPALRAEGFFRYCKATKQDLTKAVYPAPGPAGVYDAELPGGRPAKLRRLYSADVEEVLEHGPDWFFENKLDHLGLRSHVGRQVKVDTTGHWVFEGTRYVISGSKIRHSASARVEYAIVAILNRMLAQQRCPERAYGVGEGNAYAVAFLTPRLAALIRKLADQEVTPRSEAQLELLADEATGENEPPLVISDCE